MLKALLDTGHKNKREDNPDIRDSITHEEGALEDDIKNT